MHIPSGLVGTYSESEAYSQKTHMVGDVAMRVPIQFSEQAEWCADNGIKLHSHTNPHAQLRAWAIKVRAEQVDAGAVLRRELGDKEANKRRKLAEKDAKKKRIKRLRKLQKQRGVR